MPIWTGPLKQWGKCFSGTRWPSGYDFKCAQFILIGAKEQSNWSYIATVSLFDQIRNILVDVL